MAFSIKPKPKHHIIHPQPPAEEGGIPDREVAEEAPKGHPLFDSQAYKDADIQGRILLCLEYQIKNAK